MGGVRTRLTYPLTCYPVNLFTDSDTYLSIKKQYKSWQTVILKTRGTRA